MSRLLEATARAERDHFWFRGFRRFVEPLVADAASASSLDILDCGCGTGHNLAMLGGFGHVDGLELDDEARAMSEVRLGRKVMSSPLPELEEVSDGHYDLIGAFDVIEHIDDDAAALASIATKLKAGGTFIMTVPAHQWMWSAHDVVNHHKRRYSKHGLQRLISRSPMRLVKIGYFNSLLFPLAVVERAASKLRGKEDADVKLPPAPLNAVLEKIFEAERHLVGRLPLPPGLSLFAVASAR